MLFNPGKREVSGLWQSRAFGRGLQTAQGAPAARDHLHLVGGTDQRRVDPARRTSRRRRCGVQRPVTAPGRPRGRHLLAERLRVRAGREPAVARGRVEPGHRSQSDVLRWSSAWSSRGQTAVQRSVRHGRRLQTTTHEPTTNPATAQQGLAAVELRDENRLQTVIFRFQVDSSTEST